MQFDRGYISPYFVTNADKCALKWTMSIFSSTRRSSQPERTASAKLELSCKTGKPLVIVAEDVEGGPWARLSNRLRGGLKVAAVKARASAIAARPCCRIIAVLTGGQAISKISASSSKRHACYARSRQEGDDRQ